MYLASSTHIKQLDNLAVERFSITEEQLMENAAEAISNRLKEIYGTERSYAFFCGRGKNGGDGFLAARNMKLSGAKVKIFMTDSEDKLSKMCAYAYEKAKKAIVPIVNIDEKTDEDSIIVDALLGISVSGAPEGTIKKAIDKINSLPNETVSVDVPSGLNPDSGKAAGSVVKAERTLTLALDKTGLNVYPGVSFCGEKEVLDIKIPIEAVSMLQFRNYLTDDETVREMLPGRKPDGHKGTFGKIGIAGGSNGMAGSVCLAAEAALRSGVGLCYVFVPSDIKKTVELKLTEAIVLDESEIPSYMDKLDAFVIGMGYAHNNKAKHIIKTVMQKFTGPLVIDGDGLNILSSNKEWLKNKKCSVVITPHPMEFSRLTDMSVEDVNSGRIYLAEKFSAEYNVTVALKGARTVISGRDKETRINPTGNSGMATAGSGDVLSGIIGAIAAQGADVYSSACAGVYLHGLAGDFAAEAKTEYCMKSGDIIEFLPEAFKKIIL